MARRLVPGRAGIVPKMVFKLVYGSLTWQGRVRWEGACPDPQLLLLLGRFSPGPGQESRRMDGRLQVVGASTTMNLLGAHSKHRQPAHSSSRESKPRIRRGRRMAGSTGLRAQEGAAEWDIRAAFDTAGPARERPRRNTEPWVAVAHGTGTCKARVGSAVRG